MTLIAILREVFIIWSVLEKNLSGIFKIPLSVGQKVILKLTTKPIICAACPAACAQKNPLRSKILYAKKYFA
jgi:hypothetical protein